MASRFSLKVNPTASARPRAWLAIPGFPSCNTHASGRKPSVAARKAGRAAVEKEAICFVYENDPGTAREWEPSAPKIARRGAGFYDPTIQECYRMRRIRLDRIDRRILRESADRRPLQERTGHPDNRAAGPGRRESRRNNNGAPLTDPAPGRSSGRAPRGPAEAGSLSPALRERMLTPGSQSGGERVRDLSEGDRNDLIGFCAARRRDLDTFAFSLAD